MSQRSYPQLQLHQLYVGLVNGDCFGFFRLIYVQYLCVKKSELPSIEAVKLTFLFLSRGDFFEMDVIYSTFEHIYKNILFPIHHLI